MTQTVKASAIQMASGPNVDANLLEAERLVSEAARDGARIIVLPENFAFMGKSCAEVLPLKESDGDGPLQEFLSQLAQRYDIWLVGGTIPLEARDPQRVRAACLVYDDNGERRGRYDKIHLFDVNLVEVHESYAESRTIEPGEPDAENVIDTPFGRLGIAVCYDLRFPELFRHMLDQGLDMVALPAAFTAVTGKAHWEPLVRARAIENLSYIIAAAQGGYHISGRETHGHSMIVDPWGTILGELNKGAGYVCHEIDREFLSATRRNFPSLEHRRIG
ncbi:MAG: carbon-nitrogen hydrolase family protein [Pseudomonadota bacterium]